MFRGNWMRQPGADLLTLMRQGGWKRLQILQLVGRGLLRSHNLVTACGYELFENFVFRSESLGHHSQSATTAPADAADAAVSRQEDSGEQDRREEDCQEARAQRPVRQGSCREARGPPLAA